MVADSEGIGIRPKAGQRRPRKRSRALLFLSAAVLLVAAFLCRLPFCTSDLFTYDAADYSRAIRAGFLPQYLGTDSISLVRFIDRIRTDPEFRAHSWGYLYQQGDGAALRHFHVPGAFYVPAWLHAHGAGERGQRIAIAWVSAAAVSLAFLILSASGVPYWAAGLAGVFGCCSPVLILAGSNLSPHPAFTLFSIGAVYSFCRWLETSSPRWMAVFAAAFAASTASLELAPILLVTVAGAALCAWLSRPRTQGRLPLPPVRQVWLCAGSIAAFLALMWPGGWLRGGYGMSYGVFIFQGLFRSSIYFHRRDLFSTVTRLGLSPFAGWALAVLLLTVILRAWRERGNRALVAFTIFATLLVVQGFGNGFANPTYASHAVLVIAIASALCYSARNRPAGMPGRVGYWAPLAVLLLLTGAALLGPMGEKELAARRDPARISGVIAELRRTYAGRSAFVVTQDVAPFLAYAPDFRFYPAESASSPRPKPWIEIGRYRLLVDVGTGNRVPGTPLCPGAFGQFQFAISCEDLTDTRDSRTR